MGKNINANVNAWLGIPFAEKPVDYLRFKAPVSVKPWSEERKTINFEPSCTQREDCLYLNIKAPKNSSNSSVFIWIHGGKALNLEN